MSLLDFLKEKTSVKFNENGKIICGKKVKIDVGLSYNAPYSMFWMLKEPNITIFGFEPNPENINCIKNNTGFEYLPYKRFDQNLLLTNRLFLIECALDDMNEINGIKETSFYKSGKDPGTSSLYEPVDKSWLKEKITVTSASLKSFLELFDWDTLPYIEHIKIDAQGNDFRIIKSIGEYLNKFLYITAESSGEKFQYNCNQENSGHTSDDLINYMHSNNFSLTKANLYDVNTYNFIKEDYHHMNLTFKNNNYNLDVHPSLLNE